MTDLQAAVVYGLVLAFYGVALVFLLLGTCDLWLDLRDRLASRRRQRPARQPEDWRRGFNHENTNAPSGPPPLRLRRPTSDDRLDAADVVSYLRWRDQRLQRALTDETTKPPEAP